MRKSLHVFYAIFLTAMIFVASESLEAQQKLISKSDYDKYVGALLAVKDFGISYSEGGAADASILEPFHWEGSSIQYDKPPDAVIALESLEARSIPLLIDCLNDGRITAARFDGGSITKPMNVPVGYLCLDILTVVVRGEPVTTRECNRDGLGWCMHLGFYFRPDDYFNCWEGRQCKPRPWVSIVQRNWRREFLLHRLRFHNAFDNWREGTKNKTPATPNN
jgi:hypothetical protein